MNGSLAYLSRCARDFVILWVSGFNMSGFYPGFVDVDDL
jgi:hypothetical protein